ncbi:MAG: ABC transporter permease [Acidobacteriota bacterium]|nr:ABC transporter permease [Acidobacteriota bacterium]
MFFESAVLALQAIWANKLRSFLTVLGNIVAVTSIIAVVSLIQGLNASVEDAIISEVGADAFTVDRYPITQSQEEQDEVRNNPRVTMADADAIRRYATNVDAVMAQARSSADMRYRSEQLDSVQIQGVTREYASLPTTNVEQGRVITPGEFDAGRPVAILGYDTADRLFGARDPLDNKVSIAGVPFMVVGVAEKKGSIFGQSQDEYAIIPLPAFQRVFGSRRSLNLVVRPKDPSLTRAAMDETTVALRIERRLKPAEKDNFGIYSSDTFLKIYEQATAGIFAVLVGVVGLSLVVGGIVIMNIMLMVVTERTREIGLRKALGARRRDIVWQILTESITLSTFGGVVGTAVGFLIAMVIAAVSPLPAAVELWSIVLGIGITAVVGLFFGMYPAMQAAALDPIEALRRE